MESKDKSKLVVVQDGNPRGNQVSIEEVRQSITDIDGWLRGNAPDAMEALKNSKPATQEEINKLASTVLKTKIPISVEALLLRHNGNFPIKDNYKLLSLQGIEDSLEVNKVNGHWNKNYIPFAVDDENNYLCIQAENGEESKVVSWCTDIGVIEEVADSLGLLLEKMRDGILKKKVQYVEGAGLIEDTE